MARMTHGRTAALFGVAALLSAFSFALLAGGAGAHVSSGATSVKNSARISTFGNAATAKYTVGYVSPCECNPTINALSRGLAAEVKRNGGRLILVDARFNYAQINQTITSLINQKVDYLVVYGLYEIIRARLDEAKAAGIPIFAHDAVLAPSATEDFKPIYFQVVADRAAHAQAALNFIGRRNPAANALGVTRCSNPPTIKYLVEQFKAAISVRAGMTYVDTVCNRTDDVAGALPVVQDALQRYPQTTAIFAYNDETAIGAARAAETLGMRNRVIITGGNASPAGLEALRNGQLDATWDTKPVETGQILGRAIQLYRQKQLRPGNVSVKFQLFTKANVGKYVPWGTKLRQIAAGRYLGPPLPVKATPKKNTPSKKKK